jgi:Rieske Fe-S protein
MEVKTIVLENISTSAKAIIIEPFHYVEEIESNDIIEIHFFAEKHCEEPVFNIRIRDYEILIDLNFDLSDLKKKSYDVYVNNKHIFKFEW